MATIGKFVHDNEQLRFFFMELQMPHYKSVAEFFIFLNDLLPFFPIYIDCNAAIPPSEFLATRILMVAIGQLQKPKIYN